MQIVLKTNKVTVIMGKSLLECMSAGVMAIEQVVDFVRAREEVERVANKEGLSTEQALTVNIEHAIGWLMRHHHLKSSEPSDAAPYEGGEELEEYFSRRTLTQFVLGCTLMSPEDDQDEVMEHLDNTWHQDIGTQFMGRNVVLWPAENEDWPAVYEAISKKRVAPIRGSFKRIEPIGFDGTISELSILRGGSMKLSPGRYLFGGRVQEEPCYTEDVEHVQIKHMFQPNTSMYSPEPLWLPAVNLREQ